MIVKLYKRWSIAALLLLVFGSGLYAQERTISGAVKDANGGGIPGVNVIVKGTANGTTTDTDGKYSISVSGGVLVFSFIGYVAQEVEVGSQTSIDVTLVEDVTQLSEVVVTALGIERDKKALQFSMTQVNGDNFVQARENSLGNALAGRVAGVNVTKIASGPAGSSRVVIRGAKSLGASMNQPLYVVDGIPMDNTNFGQAGVWGGADQGDGMTSVNPDDIQSISVLKGASAAALYGSRAANGVILVTTKKGTSKKALGVEFNSNYVFETAINLTDLQTSFGSGGMVGTTVQNRVATKANVIGELANAWNGGWYGQAWGPRFASGQKVLHFDGKIRDYQNAGDNWERYFQTGTSFTNSLALTGGSENQNFRFSVANLESKGIIPNSGFDRVNVTLASNSKFGKKLSLTSKVMYSNERAKNRPMLSDSPGNGVQGLYRLAGDINVNDLKGDPNKLGAVPDVATQQAQGITIFDGKAPGEEMQIWSNLWGQNPWWTAYQFKNTDVRDRIITSGQLKYDITDFLYLLGSAGMDWYTLRGSRLTPEGTGYQRGGSMSENEFRNRETNFEYRLGFNKAFGSINVNAFVGGNRMRRAQESISANGNGFSVPFFASINNASQRNFGYGFNERGINSLYGSAEVAYKGYLFVTGTWRGDYFSTLNDDYNFIPYPSVGASFVFSDAFNSLPSWLSFGKVRASWGQVGNAESVGPYSVNPNYSLGQSHLGRPMAYFASANTTRSGNLPNPALVPYLSTELEFGADVRFLQGRVGLDVTYYSQKTTDDILNAPISIASGFGSTSVNLGELTNKGVEVLLTGTPVKGPLTWDISLNFAHNKSEVVSLITGVTRFPIEEPRTRTVFVAHLINRPYGEIIGLTQRRTPNGDLIFNADGAPLTDNTYNPIGNGVPKFTGGINNSLSFKGINLTFLIDFRSGGDLYSGTNVRLTGAGFHKQTLAGREGEAPLVLTGVFDTNGDNVYNEAVSTRTLTPGEAQNYWGNLSNRAQENFIYDGSFAKLRQLTLGYSLPKSWLSKTPINSLSVSFVGRNLAILFKNVDNIDPESAYSSGNAQGLDYFGMPSTRSFGFNLNASF
jgi:TonB-linked SusC/RagA family outer membrane protein